MTFLSMRPQLELCVKSLESALGMVREAAWEKCLAICIDGLKSMLTCLSSYDNTIIKTRIFCDSLCRNAVAVNEIVTACRGRLRRAELGGICELAFQLVEDLAVLMREKTLRKGGVHSLCEQRLMQYFESCGAWSCDDGTLVSEYYYLRLPLSPGKRRRAGQGRERRRQGAPAKPGRAKGKAGPSVEDPAQFLPM